jgi:NADH dehydrogenase
MSIRVVSVLGGTGFLGHRIVRHLRKRDFTARVASRHPERCQELFGTDDPHIHSVRANVRDEQSIADPIAGAQAVVNAVSLYLERGNETFHSVHVEAARQAAAQAQRAGIEQLVHVSGIGADPRSRSLYISKRGEGELAVRAEFPNAIIIRPAVLFGPDDGFLTTILELLRRLPIYPVFGSGLIRLQPAYVEDVAEAIVSALQRAEIEPITFECGGPRVYTYEELLRTIAREAGLKPILIPVPFVAWRALAWVAEMLPSPPITRNQVELMQVDNVSSSKMPGFRDLGITPHTVEETLREILQKH